MVVFQYNGAAQKLEINPFMDLFGGLEWRKAKFRQKIFSTKQV